jgi:hypothetical protein
LSRKSFNRKERGRCGMREKAALCAIRMRLGCLPFGALVKPCLPCLCHKLDAGRSRHRQAIGWESKKADQPSNCDQSAICDREKTGTILWLFGYEKALRRA